MIKGDIQTSTNKIGGCIHSSGRAVLLGKNSSLPAEAQDFWGGSHLVMLRDSTLSNYSWLYSWLYTQQLLLAVLRGPCEIWELNPGRPTRCAIVLLLQAFD